MKQIQGNVFLFKYSLIYFGKNVTLTKEISFWYFENNHSLSFFVPPFYNLVFFIYSSTNFCKLHTFVRFKCFILVFNFLVWFCKIIDILFYNHSNILSLWNERVSSVLFIVLYFFQRKIFKWCFIYNTCILTWNIAEQDFIKLVHVLDKFKNKFSKAAPWWV